MVSKLEIPTFKLLNYMLLNDLPDKLHITSVNEICVADITRRVLNVPIWYKAV